MKPVRRAGHAALLALVVPVQAAATAGEWPELPPGLVQTEITAGGQTVHLHQCVGVDALAQLLQDSSGIQQPCGRAMRSRVGGTFREQAMCPDAAGRYFMLRTDITPRGAGDLVVSTTGVRAGTRVLDVQQRLVWLGPCDMPEVWTTWGRAPARAVPVGGACTGGCRPVGKTPALDAPAAAGVPRHGR